METALVVGGTCALLGALAGALVAAVVTGRHARAQLESSRRDVRELRDRLETMARDIEAAQAARETSLPDATPEGGYVITTAGRPLPVDQPAPRSVVTATMGEPLVKVAAFLYGVRRALSPQSRNRIAFEMRQELKRARKERRRLAKQAQRDLRASQRAADGVAA